MNYLKKVGKVGIIVKIRNDDITENLKIESARKYIKKTQLRWWGHEKITRKYRKRRLLEKRRNRPSMTWDREVEDL